MDKNSLSHTTWNCKYHIVFAPKYRRQIIYGKIKAEACLDHIHMLVSIPPKYSVSEFMGYLKGKSSLMIFDKFANMKYRYGNRQFWCRGYYVDTVGRNKKAIEEYIRNQLKEDKEYEQLTMKELFDPFTGEPVAELKKKADELWNAGDYQEAAEAYSIYAKNANWLANLIQAGCEPLYYGTKDERSDFYSATKGGFYTTVSTGESKANGYKSERNRAMTYEALCYYNLGDYATAVPLLTKALDLIEIDQVEYWELCTNALYDIVGLKKKVASTFLVTMDQDGLPLLIPPLSFEGRRGFFVAMEAGLTKFDVNATIMMRDSVETELRRRAVRIHSRSHAALRKRGNGHEHTGERLSDRPTHTILRQRQARRLDRASGSGAYADPRLPRAAGRTAYAAHAL